MFLLLLASMAKRKLSALVWQEEKLFVAKLIGIELASQGRTEKEALNNLKEAVELLLEDENVKLPTVGVPKNPELRLIYA